MSGRITSQVRQARRRMSQLSCCLFALWLSICLGSDSLQAARLERASVRHAGLCRSSKKDSKSDKKDSKSDKKESKSSKKDSKSSKKDSKSDKKSSGKSSKKDSKDKKSGKDSSKKSSKSSKDDDRSSSKHSSDKSGKSGKSSGKSDHSQDSDDDKSRRGDGGSDDHGGAGADNPSEGARDSVREPAARSGRTPGAVTRGGYESKIVAETEPLALDPLFGAREIGDCAWTPDSRRLIVVTNLSGKPNLWAADINGIGWPQQLTFSDVPIEAPQVSPDGRSILFQAFPSQTDPAVRGNGDLYLIGSNGGTPYNLTSSPTVDERQGAWSPDGKAIAYLSNEETPDSYQVYVRELQPGKAASKARRISRTVQSSMRLMWSPDGEKILVSRYRTGRDANLVLVDPKGGEEIVLTPHQGEQLWLATGWSADGKRVLASSNSRGRFQVATVDVASHQVTWVTEETEGEAMAQAYSPTENRAAWTTTSRGNVQVFTGAPLSTVKAGQVHMRKGNVDQARFSPDGRLLAFRYQGATRAEDWWVYDLSRNVARQITFSLVAGVRAEQLVEPVAVHYASFDGVEISGLLYIPHNLSEEGRRPVIIWAHDGPDQQFLNGFEPEIQFLVNRGYIVLAPNYRGSKGNGQAFESLNDLDWGGGDLHDLAQAAGFVKTVPFADPSRVVIAGRGYGGFLALLAMARTPELWAAGVALGAPVELQEAPSLAPLSIHQLVKLELGSPEERPALWADRSVLPFADNIRAPLLMIYGANDPLATSSRVKAVTESLTGRGQSVDFKTIPDEPRRWGIDVKAPRQALLVEMKSISTFLEKAVGPQK